MKIGTSCHSRRRPAEYTENSAILIPVLYIVDRFSACNNRSMESSPGRISTDTCKRNRVRGSSSLIVAGNRNGGHASVDVCRLCPFFSDNVIVIDSVSIVHPDTSVHVSQSNIFWLTKVEGHQHPTHPARENYNEVFPLLDQLENLGRHLSCHNPFFPKTESGGTHTPVSHVCSDPRTSGSRVPTAWFACSNASRSRSFTPSRLSAAPRHCTPHPVGPTVFQ